MKTFLLGLLAATAIAPAAATAQEEGGRAIAEQHLQIDAQPGDAQQPADARGPQFQRVQAAPQFDRQRRDGGRQSPAQPRFEQRDFRRPQFQQPQFQRPQFQRPPFQTPQVQQPQPIPQAQVAPPFQRSRPDGQFRGTFRQAFGQDGRDVRQDRREDGRDFRQDRRFDNRDFRQDRRFDNRDFRQDRRFDNRGFNSRSFDNRAYGYNGGGNYYNNSQWNRDWRRNNQYNWQNYRAYNRGIFNLPRYYSPYGYNYGYQRFSIGYTLNSLLFDRRYWINDPYYYRLPEVYGDYKWIRYYGDALLVDLRTCEVVDVVYDIFY